MTRFFRIYARAAGTLAIGVGLIVLIGWRSGSESMVTLLTGLPPMLANSALVTILLGTALVLLAPSPAPGAATIVGRLCAMIAVVIAALTLSEYLLGIDLGIDQLLVRTRTALDEPYPGRPPLQSAATFLLSGLALLLIDLRTRGGRRPAELLALLSWFIPIIALLEYLYGAEERSNFRSLLPYTGMALNTALVLVALNSGVLAARAETGLLSVTTADDLGGIAARRLLLGIAALLPVALVLALGVRAGWYSEPVGSALILFFALVEGAGLILFTATRLSRLHAEMRQVETALRTSEAQIRELIELAPEGIFIADVQDRWADINTVGSDLVGYTRDEMVGKSILDVILVNDYERFRIAKEGLRRGERHRTEWMVRHKSGALLPVEVSTKGLPDGRWMGFVRDLRERKETEAALIRAAEVERKLRAQLQELATASDALSETVADLPRSDLNAVLQVIALQAQALTHARYVAIGLGTNPSEPFSPWVSLGVPQEVAKAVGGPPRPVGTLGLVATEGEVVRVADVREHPAFRGYPQHHPSMTSFLGVPIHRHGRPVGNIYLAEKEGAAEFTEEDVHLTQMLAARAAAAIETAQVYASESLQRAWLQTIIDQMPEGVILLDAKGKVTAMNKAILALSLGEVRRKDPYGNPAMFDARTPDGKPISFEELPIIRALHRGEVSVQQELLLRQRDGSFVPVLANSAPVRDEAGRITGATVIVQDISARKELERLREEWASIVAHDLRQPASSILLTSELLYRSRSGHLSDRDRKAFEVIRSSSARLNRMINDLLDSSRIEAKRLTVNCRAVELDAVIRSAIEGLQEPLGRHRVRLNLDPDLTVWADSDRIHQVLTNLITNALKYGGEDGEIRVRAGHRGDQVQVTVENEGPGIPADQLPLLFSRFARTREAQASRTSGLGLGLYISKGLVEAHGGTMWAESEPGKVTRFHFTLPRRPGQSQPAGDAGAHTVH